MAPLKVIDKSGRCMPMADSVYEVFNRNPNFKSGNLPNGATFERFESFAELFPGNERLISFQKFSQLVEKLFFELEKNQQLSNFLKGSCFPICFPKTEINGRSYSEIVRETFLPAFKQAYQRQFPDREFSERFCDCDEDFEIMPESRHFELLEKLQERPVTGLLFFPFQGFSVEASRRQMSCLPDSCLLSGAIDILVALAMYPGVLAKNSLTLGYLCSANRVLSRDSKYGSLYGRALGKGFNFGFSSDLSSRGGIFSSGLLYVGE